MPAFLLSARCRHLNRCRRCYILLRSALMAVFFQLTRVDYCSATSFLLVFVLDIIDAQASLQILFSTSSQDLFRIPLFIYPGTLPSLIL